VVNPDFDDPSRLTVDLGWFDLKERKRVHSIRRDLASSIS
jgi:hypothetical protein